MKNYLFSTVAAACAIELIFEFAPFIRDATLKKYLRYIIALVLSICIIAPFTESVGFGEFGMFLEEEGNIVAPIGSKYIYFENDSVLLECDKQGFPERNAIASCDMYIRECCFGIIRNAKLALSNKFSIDQSDISIGISFDVTDISNIEIICAYVNVISGSDYLKSDACDYLEKNLGCAVYKMEVRQ